MSSSEIKWRRTWKPTLSCVPWQAFNINGKKYLYKFLSSTNSYSFMITDLKDTFQEVLIEDLISERSHKLNPSILVSVEKVLDHISIHMESISTSKFSIKITGERCAIGLETKLAGLPFMWKFVATPSAPDVVSSHMTVPVMGMVAELHRRQMELVQLLQRKDKEIDDYKAQGARVTRKHLLTVPFDEVAFKNTMNTAKGFEEVAANPAARAFSDSESRQLYTDLMMKQAWLNRPTDNTEEDTGSPQKATKPGATGGSWNSRVPGSLVSPSTSPTKASQATGVVNRESPEKAANSESPAKDTELLRRQALERRLAEEEEKKEHKKKKKKLKL